MQPCVTPCEQEPESLLSFCSFPVVGRCHDSSASNSKTFPFVLHDYHLTESSKPLQVKFDATSLLLVGESAAAPYRPGD
ncbi:hypothetical protein GOODEAATRI_030286, partial [Goodea atripinnis]